jgi:hypothetical protein
MTIVEYSRRLKNLVSFELIIGQKLGAFLTIGNAQETQYISLISRSA